MSISISKISVRGGHRRVIDIVLPYIVLYNRSLIGLKYKLRFSVQSGYVAVLSAGAKR